MSSKWSSTSSYLTGTKPVWTPHGRPKDVLKMIVYRRTCSYLTGHNTCLNTPWTSKRCPQRSSSYLTYKKPVPIWSSTSSYLTDTTPVWTPHGRPNDVLKVIVYQFLLDWHNTCLNTPWTSKRCPQSDRLPVPIWLTQNQFEHHMDVQKMSSKWSSTCSYLTVWTQHVLCLNTPWTSKRCPQRSILFLTQVPIWVST